MGDKLMNPELIDVATLISMSTLVITVVGGFFYIGRWAGKVSSRIEMIAQVQTAHEAKLERLVDTLYRHVENHASNIYQGDDN